MITFFKSRNIESRAKVEPATGQYIGRYRTGLDVVAQTHYQLVAASIVEANSTTTVINCTNHLARVGDAISITSGALSGDRVFVQSTTTNSITLSQTLASAPIAGVTFDILRPALPRTGLPLYTNGDVAMPTDFVGRFSVAVAFTASATGGTTTFTAAGHAARRGDIVFFLGSGLSANPNVERTVESVTATTITLSVALPAVVQAGDAFNITRMIPLSCDSGGRVNVNAATTISGLVVTNVSQWNGVTTETQLDDFSTPHPQIVAQGWDVLNNFPANIPIITSAPGGSSLGVVTRNIPSGTQNMRGVALVASAPVRVSCSTGTTLLAANANRRKFIITNFNTQFIYWKLGTGCSSTSYSGVIAPYTSYESFIDDATEIITIATQFGSVFVGGQEFT